MTKLNDVERRTVLEIARARLGPGCVVKRFDAGGSNRDGVDLHFATAPGTGGSFDAEVALGRALNDALAPLSVDVYVKAVDALQGPYDRMAAAHGVRI